MSENTSESKNREALEKIVNNCNTAFFVSKGTEAPFHGRPMANAKVEEGLAAIWFASHRVSGKTSELKENHDVLLGYTNSSGSEWASVNGMASLVNDRAKIKELWSSMWNNWFDGPDDPNIELIKVTPLSAEFWDNGSKAIAMMKFAVGAVTGMKMDSGKNEKMKL